MDDDYDSGEEMGDLDDFTEGLEDYGGEVDDLDDFTEGLEDYGGEVDDVEEIVDFDNHSGDEIVDLDNHSGDEIVDLDNHSGDEIFDLDNSGDEYAASGDSYGGEDSIDSNEYFEDKGDQTVHPINFVPHLSSLKEICLECISKNFGKFNTAYCTSEDASLRRNLEFLQRVYTSHLIKSLSKRGCLDDEHLDFLLNEYLKELDIGKFSHCSQELIIRRIAQVGHGFVKVSFKMPIRWGVEFSEFVNKIIGYLSNVNILHIPRNCNNTTLKIIAAFCPNLQELNIDGSYDVTDEGVEMLCKGRGDAQTKCVLKFLSLDNTTVRESGIVYLLKNVPSLEVLNHIYLPEILYCMHKDNIKNNTLNSVKYNLTKFDFLSTSNLSTTATDVISVWAEYCPNITTLLTVIDTEDHLKLLTKFSKLEDLTVQRRLASESGQDVNNFLKTNGVKLKNLQISGGFTLSVSKLIASCPKLEFLMLSCINFQSMEDSNVNSLNNLCKLHLEGFKFTDQYVEAAVHSILQSSTKLEELSLVRCEFGNSEMSTKLAKFCENSGLQKLGFIECDIDVALLESIILTCSSLNVLTIEFCYNIKSENIINLSKLAESVKNLVQIKCNDYESDLDSIFSNENNLFDDFFEYTDSEFGDEYEEYDDEDDDEFYPLY